MTVYIKVQEVASDKDPCTGCVADATGTAWKEGLCVKLRGDNNGCISADFGMPGYIFIEDTEAARLAYITLKLEN